MAKSKEQIVARRLRGQGLSIKEISLRLSVSKSSVSLWCKDIVLSKKQIENLHAKMVRGSYSGRMKGVQVQKDRKRANIQRYLTQAKKDIPILTERELFMIGLGLYWGEGSKIASVRFYNQDEHVIRFIMRWFRESLHIDENRFMMYININELHASRIEEVIHYWSRVCKVPVKQFRKPTLLHVKTKKVYENISEHHGTLCIRIAKSSNLLYQIQGWMEVSHKAG